MAEEKLDLSEATIVQDDLHSNFVRRDRKATSRICSGPGSIFQFIQQLQCFSPQIRCLLFFVLRDACCYCTRTFLYRSESILKFRHNSHVLANYVSISVLYVWIWVYLGFTLFLFKESLLERVITLKLKNNRCDYGHILIYVYSHISGRDVTKKLDFFLND